VLMVVLASADDGTGHCCWWYWQVFLVALATVREGCWWGVLASAHSGTGYCSVWYWLLLVMVLATARDGADGGWEVWSCGGVGS
jgi:hypothetical protein